MSSDILTECTTGTHLLKDLTTLSSYAQAYYAYDYATSHKESNIFAVCADLTVLSKTTKMRSFLSTLAGVSKIDNVNYRRKIRTGVYLYVITDLTALTDEYATQFTSNGIYAVSDGDYTNVANIQLVCYTPCGLDKHYLPTDTIYSSDLATVATTGDYNDLLNTPAIATDDEIIEMISQEDMLPVVADSDGAILSDENENILLW